MPGVIYEQVTSIEIERASGAEENDVRVCRKSVVRRTRVLG